ncbi:hypothetical protein P872_05705 [Rhodonellum psychrophilum GCM71 = DSM 17998]|uniref:Dephospho-CoA kinase n=2 Tax=Rhodonellum TaxID=336827 RepID=U5BY69_9BACT|nr:MULTISPECIES: dephospho-CoA kinase [Rhodonellum]ERM82519.1 hypothetical protein P872_05705 [Rhodonellum psychrophilum GCM71 = DSM 17998]MDO9552302.1 dephospho-CoA kinase [Rhodonellum sp.]SDY54822.1 dephospho-CoA kinase [Rhodonellum ikkaensis]
MIDRKPLLVGLTGGIGSGKSTVAKVFQILNIPIYFADDRAKWLMAKDEGLKHKIKSEFGEAVYNEDGSLNRKHLAAEVFADDQKIKALNNLVHPAVREDFSIWASSQSAPYVLKEAALIFETGGDKDLDKVINVSSPLKVRVSRILMRDAHRDENQVNDIIDMQLPDEEKNSKSDFVIKNTDNKLLIPQVLQIHQKLLLEASV